MAKTRLSIDLWIAGVIFFFDILVVTSGMVRTTSMARTTRLAQIARFERMSTDYSNFQVTLQITLPISLSCLVISRTDMANDVHAMGRLKTEHFFSHLVVTCCIETCSVSLITLSFVRRRYGTRPKLRRSTNCFMR